MSRCENTVRRPIIRNNGENVDLKIYEPFSPKSDAALLDCPEHSSAADSAPTPWDTSVQLIRISSSDDTTHLREETTQNATFILMKSLR